MMKKRQLDKQKEIQEKIKIARMQVFPIPLEPAVEQLCVRCAHEPLVHCLACFMHSSSYMACRLIHAASSKLQ